MYLAVDGKLVRFERKTFELEKHWQELFSDFPELLSDGIPGPVGTGSGKWLLVQPEYPLLDGDGNTIFVDHLFLDQNGIPTLVEVKRARNPENKRTVVAQMLDYAAAITTCDVRDIQRRFANNLRADAEARLREFLADGDIEQFWQQVKTNLEAKRIRMVFVADEIPSTLRRLIEFLNEQLRVAEVIGIEVGRLVAGERQAFVPTVIGRTAEAEARKAVSVKVERTVDNYFSFVANPALRPKGVDKANGAMALLENLQLIRQWGEDPNNNIEFSVSPAATNPRLILSKAGVVIIGVQADGGLYLYGNNLTDPAARARFSELLHAEAGLTLPATDGETAKLYAVSSDNLRRLLVLLGSTA
ncbi:hypothetical protein [Paraburkholderia hospita]|uniref:hypothetical protein n=1 Tax=Paraburkholderia hospita TaxID=169430 RepID=UPI001178126A|nr:hypothetical protein [Paraburkholderia hospita]